MIELLHNQEVVSKAKQELEQTIGIGNPIEESDVAKLPCLQAIIKQALRLHPPGPLLLPRKAKIDVEISGYTIPQGARVLINEWDFGRNPNIWDNANLFLLKTCLGSKIHVKGRDFQLTPFGRETNMSQLTTSYQNQECQWGAQGRAGDRPPLPSPVGRYLLPSPTLYLYECTCLETTADKQIPANIHGYSLNQINTKLVTYIQYKINKLIYQKSSSIGGKDKVQHQILIKFKP